MPTTFDSSLWKARGDKYVKKQEYDQAVYCYEVALRFDQENRSALNNLGYTHQLMGNEKESQKVKKKLEELANRNKPLVVQSKRSLFDDDLILFFIFFPVLWGVLLYYWYHVSLGTDLLIGAAMTGLLAFIATGWAWAFFILWDTERFPARIIGLILTGVIVGGIFILFRTAYSKVLNY